MSDRAARRRAQRNGAVTMTLSVPQRAYLMGVLPAQESIVALRAKRELVELLSPDSEEAERAGYNEVMRGIVNWNALTAHAVVKEITLTAEQAGLLRPSLKKASDEKRLHEDLIEVWDALGMDGYKEKV